MDTPYFPIELNGIKYRLAEDAEGDHYRLSGEPRRPPNGIVVQGEESQQKFQLRPDILVWSLTDWSGGMGQVVYDPQNPNRWRKLIGVRPFVVPGTLRAGMYGEQSSQSGGTLNEALVLVRGPNGNTYGLDQDAATIYEFSAGVWDAGNSLTGGPANGAGHACSDGISIYFIERTTDNVWKVNPTSSYACTQIDSGGMSTALYGIVELGDYVYVMDGANGVWEIAKDGSSETLILDLSAVTTTGMGKNPLITAGDGQIYAMTTSYGRTKLYQVTPTTAAEVGYGRELLDLSTLVPDALWYSSPHIIVVADPMLSVGLDDNVILYIDPNGTYGSLGTFEQIKLDKNTQRLTGGGQNWTITDHFFAIFGVDLVYSVANAHGLVQINAANGGFAVTGTFTENEDDIAGLLAVSDDGIFYSVDGQNAATDYVWHFYPNRYDDGLAVSPWYDFGILEEKILSSIALHMEPLPADWTIDVDYVTDGDDDAVADWTEALSVSATGSTGTKAAVSTDTTTVTFQQLSVRVHLRYTGGTYDTETPVIRGIEVFAQVNKPYRVWDLLLDLSDDRYNKGADKIANLETAASTNTVVKFLDGYQNRDTGVTEDLDVIVDSYELNLQRPGAGIASVRLVEVA